jgi:hypothetical protein
MWSKYNFEFQIAKNTIIAFLVTELAGLILFAYIQIQSYNGNEVPKWLSIIKIIYNVSGLRSTNQAVGFLYVKQSRDPLEGIQQLEFMNLVSNI